MKTKTDTILLLPIVGLLLLATCPAMAQTSASHKLTESAFDQGGNMNSTGAPASAAHRVSMSALGGSAAGWALLSSTSHHVQGGFVSAYPPPGEVVDLRFADSQTLEWSDEPSTGRYELYRGTLASLGGSFGTCLQAGLGSATATDATSPSPGLGWGYLVTARNRIGEEGRAGQDSQGGSRSVVTICP